MLGDLMAKGHDEEKAMHHYNVALNLDPKNVPAQEGLQKMEHATDTALEATYDMEMEEANSDEGIFTIFYILVMFKIYKHFLINCLFIF